MHQGETKWYHSSSSPTCLPPQTCPALGTKGSNKHRSYTMPLSANLGGLVYWSHRRSSVCTWNIEVQGHCFGNKLGPINLMYCFNSPKFDGQIWPHFVLPWTFSLFTGGFDHFTCWLAKGSTCGPGKSPSIDLIWHNLPSCRNVILS